MSKHFVIMSFELNDNSLIDEWKALSKEIDEDIFDADGFISRDSGIDENLANMKTSTTQILEDF